MYEAWTVYLSSDYDEPVSASKFCGITTVKEYDSFRGAVSSISELYDQKDLMDMYLKSLDKYKSKHKRAWPSRIIRGTPRSYENDIDSRIRKLPGAVQSEICHLLGDREDASSNRFHNRAWTVVLMQEQLHRRFADASPKVIDKRHKVRFWKNPGKNEPTEYFVIIRGREGRRVTDPRGQTEFKRFENPWQDADAAEARRKTREHFDKVDKLLEKRAKRIPPPLYRYSPPTPPPPPPRLPNRGMYHAPGAYTRPHLGMPSYAPPCVPPAPRVANPVSNDYTHLPPVPNPPMSYPPPPSWRCPPEMNMYGVPTRSVQPPPAPRPPMYAPPSHLRQPQPPNHPGTNTFLPGSGAYTKIFCGGPYNGMQETIPAPHAPAPPPPPPPATRPIPGGPARYPYPGFPFGRPCPGGMVNSFALRTAYSGAASVTSLGEYSDKASASGKEADEDDMHLCGNDDASETCSVQSWEFDRRKSGAEEAVGEKGKEGGRKPEEDAEHAAKQEKLQQLMNKLIEDNKRRIQLAMEAKSSGGGSPSASAGSGKDDKDDEL